MFMEETLGTRINGDRAAEIIASGAKTVATACPFCITMIRDGIMDKDAKVDVKDIVAPIVDRLDHTVAVWKEDKALIEKINQLAQQDKQRRIDIRSW